MAEKKTPEPAPVIVAQIDDTKKKIEAVQVDLDKTLDKASDAADNGFKGRLTLKVEKLEEELSELRRKLETLLKKLEDESNAKKAQDGNSDAPGKPDDGDWFGQLGR